MKLAPHYRRLLFLTILLVCGLLALIGRFYLLQIAWHKEIAAEADKFSRTRRLIQPWRGEIRDRIGRPLAWSVPVVDVYANLDVCKDHVESVARVVGPFLAVDRRRLLKSMYEGLLEVDGGPKEAVLLKRNVSMPEWESLRNAITNSNFGMEVERLSRRERAVLTSLRKNALFARETQMREYLIDDFLPHVIGAVTCPRGRLMP
jgi:cell division protein FtsI/penicillin-binding protein 2